MKIYKAEHIRNVAFLGHGGSGKTTLTEAILFSTNLVNRMGKIEDGNTVSDFDKEETTRGISIGTSSIPVEWQEHKINILDTPGYFDFIGEVQSALKAADGVVILVDASNSVEVGTEKSWDFVTDNEKPAFVFINKMDRENTDFDKVLNDLREKFGNKITPFQIPLGEDEDYTGNINIVKMVAEEYDGKDYTEKPIPENLTEQVNSIREMLLESVAESDEALLEKYFEGEAFTEQEIQEGLRKGIVNGDIIPVLCGSSTKNIGTHSLLDRKSVV